MFSIVRMIKQEFIYLFEYRKNYLYQTLMHYVSRLIYLVGMISVIIISGQTIDSLMVLKISFWFILVNTFSVTSKRIETEFRLHQYAHCVLTKISYWYQSIIRLIPIIIESLVIALIAFLYLSYSTRIIGDVLILPTLIYTIIAIIQIIILNLVLTLLVLYFKRIQAVLGFIESITFFYSGMVLIYNQNQFCLFKWMDQLLEANYSVLPWLFIFTIVEILLVSISSKKVMQYLKTNEG